MTQDTPPERQDIPEYDPAEIEPRWQRRWEDDGAHRSERLPHDDAEVDRPKHYALAMLPYPSGNLHIGHWYALTPPDARARFFRMRGYNVMYPMGFDAFGLPAENAAIKHDVHPGEWTYKNIDTMRRQLQSMGAMFDWRREAISADPEYYRWTQWFFLRFLEHDLAYRKQAPVDWCPSCNTTLAREQVIGEDRECERCRTPVVKKDLTQWFFRTTRYVEELLDFSQLDWPERVQTLQSRWIGRSEGARIDFATSLSGGEPIRVFTTRPDTLWGATFMVLAPEHPLVEQLTTDAQRAEVEAYVEQAGRQSDIQRETADREKTGVFTGGYAVNPGTGEEIPVWIADYVLMTYGTGAIMAVPAHDQRDFEFARRFDLPIRVVVAPDEGEVPDPAEMTESYPAKNALVNSGPLTGISGDDAVPRTVAHLEDMGVGEGTVNFRLRDWLVSRQRYWGAPIPVVYCDACGVVPVPEDQLPVTLPEEVEWRPTGESPLKLHETWRHTTCPACGGAAERETDTMDTFMDSSWYHLRYLSPEYDAGPFDPDEYDYWMAVDTYTGGIEHATMHLIYTRFFHKACRDMAKAGVDLLAPMAEHDEPMLQLRNQGIILGEDSEKMSKSQGNVVSPDDLVEFYGADAVRAYLMFFARWEQGGPWSSTGIEGTSRWLKRVWHLALAGGGGTADAPDEGAVRALRRKLHQTIARVTSDFEGFSFNTIIPALMELQNEMSAAASAGVADAPSGPAADAWSEAVDAYLRMLAPVAPHVAEELWHRLGKDGSVHAAHWPEPDAEAAREDEITLVVQVNGKVRDKLTLPADVTEDTAKEAALASDGAARFTEGQTVRKVIYVPGRLVNIVAT